MKKEEESAARMSSSSSSSLLAFLPSCFSVMLHACLGDERALLLSLGISLSPISGTPPTSNKVLQHTLYFRRGLGFLGLWFFFSFFARALRFAPAAVANTDG